jgi:hypothetical protein
MYSGYKSLFMRVFIVFLIVEYGYVLILVLHSIKTFCFAGEK